MPASQHQSNSKTGDSAQEKGKSKQQLSVADEEIEQERQTHLRTIELLDRVANGEKAAGRLLPADLLEDPLDAHLLYVRWTLDTYGPQEENLKKNLIIILEQSTRRFVNEKQYRSDLRYLKLWVLYARHCSKLGATKIYEYLNSKEIGIDFSMFYEEWASSVDQHPDNLKTIEEIFDLGIQRGAEPLNRLKKKKISVLKRVSQSTSDRSPQPPTPNCNELCDDPLKNHRISSSADPPKNPTEPPLKKPPAPTTQKLALDLSKLYPGDGVEISPEEYKATQQYGSRRWGVEPWEVEASTSGKWYHYNLDGTPILYDPVSQEPLFDYLKASSSASSEMQLSDDENLVHDLLDSKSDSSEIPPTEADQSMADSEPMENLNLANITTSTDEDLDDDVSGQEAIADAEISINLDSPVRNDSVGYIKPRNRRASVTMNTQEAINEVYNMYGKPAKNSDESDDNFDNSDLGDDDRLYDENTAYTVAGVRDATADVTFWSQPQQTSNPNDENHLGNYNPAQFQDENALACRQPLNGLSSSSGPSRGLGAFKPVRKPLAPVVPFADENEISMAPFSGPKPTYPAPGARIPLADKATYPQQPLTDREALDEREPDRRVLQTNRFQWEPENPANQFPNEYNTPDIQKDMPLFPSQEEYQSDMDREDEAEYENNHYQYEDDVDREDRLIARPLRFVPTGDNFNALTPITERTSEYNSMTAPRYVNRIQEAQFSLHQQRTGKFPGVVFDDDDDEAELTPKPNHLNDENSGQDSSYPNENFPDHRGPGQMFAKACEIRDSPYRLRHSLETPSKIVAQLQHSSLPRAPNSLSRSPENDHDNDSVMASPLRTYSKQYIPPSPTTIQACEPCNPFAPDIVNILLEGLDPPLDSYPGYQSLVDHRSEKLQQLRKRCKTRNRKHSHGSVTAEEALWEVNLGDDLYIIYEKLGEGTYGSVFRVSESVEEDCTAMYEDNSIQKAMKVESPPNLYEFSILSQLHQTLSERLCESIIKPHKLYAYADESFLVMDYSDQGTLLDIVNRAAEIGIKPTAPGIVRGVDELVAMFFTIELMRVVEGLHEAGYIHGDLKVDNCMVRLQSIPGGNKSWLSTYDPQGQNGWSYKGLKLIDYGRAIDTGVFPPSQEFIAEWETDEYDCLEMRTGKAWSFQPDYHGILGIAHCLLFGSFMTEKDSIKPGFKRYHQTELWANLFEVCLNPSHIPNTLDLRSVRFQMEDWLQNNCEKGGKSLKGLLKKIEVASLSYH
ncbi:BUB protein kinase [Puccinia graminis f. sp. tritici CRL 75-36-700-3]|uniref:BUB protein kinase n=1 Tax=Puccinia graminis f. sp. tritici (strain CRL 75-36-700-3 / race SCCL) TaxID=418459 RepID=E3KRJ7_PUCGT|nr:BUB protein kinase [Puccinia graminis f. sp. tritici CRL 75-36-700-3]EFP86922.1 BUB protein kinase [Puccinia graminis f. sp. tritici CRL 75-36-700-3]